MKRFLCAALSRFSTNVVFFVVLRIREMILDKYSIKNGRSGNNNAYINILLCFLGDRLSHLSQQTGLITSSIYLCFLLQFFMAHLSLCALFIGFFSFFEIG